MHSIKLVVIALERGHTVIMLVFYFRFTGPLFTTSMFGPESAWNQLSQYLKNRKDPEANMINSYADLQAIMFEISLGNASSSVEFPEFWCKEDYIVDVDCPVEAGPKLATGRKLDQEDIRYLHDLYCRILPDFKSLWEEALNNYVSGLDENEIKHLGLDVRGRVVRFETTRAFYDMYKMFLQKLEDMLGRDPTEEEKAMVKQGIKWGSVEYRSVDIGPIKFKPGSWALARPDKSRMNRRGKTREAPQFGKILNIYSHIGPDGEWRLVVRMDWHDTVAAGKELFHDLVRAPLISSRRRDITRDRFVMWQVKDIVPIPCLAERNFDDDSSLIMLARTWSGLTHLGFQKQDHHHPYEGMIPDLESSEDDSEDDAPAP